MKKPAPKEKRAAKSDDTVEASPSKRFFVEMLTRDIELRDAVLDLLDNCVDGILRSSRRAVNAQRPYEGFWAKIEFNTHRFRIEDNCGGIPLDLAKNHAFMLGRPRVENNDGNKPTVGMYGIGMKRAIFKMGRESRVTSRTAATSFEVTIERKWLTDEGNWKLPLNFIDPVKDSDNKTVVGTTVDVSDLYDGIKNIFSETGSAFQHDFTTAVAQHFSFIIKKGFSVTVNGTLIKPKPLVILTSELTKDSRKKDITPYIYNATLDDVKVRLVVGFNTPMLTPDEVDEEQEVRRRTGDAGWTIICNDRVIVYNDRSRLTGWGEADVPSYHTQFIAISGVVHFQSNDAWKLPITSTKRDLDSSSELYLYVKDFMREGMKKFTTYTYKWKTYPDEEKRISKRATATPIEELLKVAPNQTWTRVRGKQNEMKFNLELPEPHHANPNKQIRFFRPLSAIREVALFLFQDPEVTPAEVGEKCFDNTVERAKQ
jgi:Histidine kinase-, DNA gyrase B-, and HSP90-like ATPase